MPSKRLLCASALCMASAFSHSANLSTFGAGHIINLDLLEDNNFTNYVHYLHSLNMLHGGDLRPIMQVANNGTVVFVNETAEKANVWSLQTGEYQFGLGSQNRMMSLNITANGRSIAAFGQRFDLNEHSQMFESSIWRALGSFLSPDGSTTGGTHAGAGTTPGNTIANYPYYHELNELAVSFEDAGNSAYGRFSSLGHRPAVETFLRAPYEELYIVDASGDASKFLAYQNVVSDAGGDSYLTLGNAQRDFILMDKRGRFRSVPYSVLYPVELSHNGKQVLAYDYIDDCPQFDEIYPRECAIIWKDDNTVKALGNFMPHAMSGDATYVIGRSNSNKYGHSTINVPVVWTSSGGVLHFIEAMADEGVDFSGWSDIYPLDISQDGSKIVGHGINPEGIREGFLVDRTSHEASLWAQTETSDSSIETFFDWSDSSVDNQGDQSARISSERAAKLAYTFTGDHVKVLGTKGLNNGYVNVYIDNVFWGSIDTFDCAETYVDTIFDSGYIGEGEHTIIVEVAGRQHLSSQGNGIGIDAFQTKAYLTESNTPNTASLIPEPKFDAYNITYSTGGDPAELSMPGELVCGIYGCAKEWHRWSDYLHAAQLVSKDLDNTINTDGSFAMEVWFRDTRGTLLTLSDAGKVFSVWVEGNPNNLNWTGKSANASDTPLDYRYSESGIVEFYPIGAQDRAKRQISWNHVAISGNWFNGNIRIYLNGQQVGEGASLENGRAVENLLLLGKSVDKQNFGPNMYGEVGKFASYDEELNASQVAELHEWPTRYGLSFAPNTSPEYSTRIPGCSTGCEPGLDLTTLPILSGVGLSSPGIGGL